MVRRISSFVAVLASFVLSEMALILCAQGNATFVRRLAPQFRHRPAHLDSQQRVPRPCQLLRRRAPQLRHPPRGRPRDRLRSRLELLQLHQPRCQQFPQPLCPLPFRPLDQLRRRRLPPPWGFALVCKIVWRTVSTQTVHCPRRSKIAQQRARRVSSALVCLTFRFAVRSVNVVLQRLRVQPDAGHVELPLPRQRHRPLQPFIRQPYLPHHLHLPQHRPPQHQLQRRQRTLPPCQVQHHLQRRQIDRAQPRVPSLPRHPPPNQPLLPLPNHPQAPQLAHRLHHLLCQRSVQLLYPRQLLRWLQVQHRRQSRRLLRLVDPRCRPLLCRRQSHQQPQVLIRRLLLQQSQRTFLRPHLVGSQPQLRQVNLLQPQQPPLVRRQRTHHQPCQLQRRLAHRLPGQVLLLRQFLLRVRRTRRQRQIRPQHRRQRRRWLHLRHHPPAPPLNRLRRRPRPLVKTVTLGAATALSIWGG
mmetsp:Transcript_14436/g.37144  ORF Transcript_14436/g.37144 Transcript_14436/m.37144 type:complete len:469 (+) Transcript_14436:742-2148(+)